MEQSAAPSPLPRDDAWGAALLEALLPAADGKPPRLLACDDGVVERVGADAFGLERERAVPAFVAAVERRWTLTTSGLASARNAARGFRVASGTPREPPRFFPVCCLLVLAASRMDADSEHSAHAYYSRLMGDLLGHPDRKLAAEDQAPVLFKLLAEWLTRDLAGGRGLLVLPEQPWPAYVGWPISQCVFRARDRATLMDFFDARHVRSSEEVDPLALLRAWPGRGQLTQRAREALFDPRLAGHVRAALVVARDTWDESVLLPGGQHHWRGVLRLRPRSPTKLYVSAANQAPLVLAGLGTLDPGRELELDPFELLPRLRRESVVLKGDGDRVSIAAAAVDTLTFELDPAHGLLRVNAVSADHVHLLTADKSLASQLVQYDAEAEDDLPPGWWMLARVPRAQVPEALQRPAKVERPPLALEGGLRIGRQTYLAGGGPDLQAGQLDEPVTVQIRHDNDRRQVLGTIAAGESLRLNGLAVGSHRLQAGDDAFATVLRIEPSGPQAGWGTVGWPLENARAHLGASELTGAAALRGASEAATADVRFPLLRAMRKPVTVIDRHGHGRRVFAPTAPAWLAEVGLPPAQARWELVLDEDDCWILGSQDVVCVHCTVPAAIDAEAVRGMQRLPERVHVRAIEGETGPAKAAFAMMRKLAAQDR